MDHRLGGQEDRGATMKECPKCQRVHEGKPGEKYVTCPSCHHLYPERLFEGGYRNIDCCVFCADRMQDAVNDYRQDQRRDAMEEDDEN